MGGDIKMKYAAASTTMTVTNLHSLASSQDWSAGWTSASVDNTSNNYLDYMLSGTFTTHASNRQAGSINIYIIAALKDTPTWVATATGTVGSEGGISFTDTEERDSIAILIRSLTVDTTASAIYAFPPTSIAQLFGGIMPTHFAVYVSQNASTTTTAGLAASGSAIYYTPITAQYT